MVREFVDCDVHREVDAVATAGDELVGAWQERERRVKAAESGRGGGGSGTGSGGSPGPASGAAPSPSVVIPYGQNFGQEGGDPSEVITGGGTFIKM